MSFHSDNDNAILVLRPIENWDVSKITDMNSIFRDAPGVETCNPDIGNWTVSSVQVFVSQSLVSMRSKSRFLIIAGVVPVLVDVSFLDSMLLRPCSSSMNRTNKNKSNTFHSSSTLSQLLI
jgi:hypothetical protein